MNILYCGDSNIIDGLVISLLSLIKNTKDELHIFVFTMKFANNLTKYQSLPKEYIEELDKIVKKTNRHSYVKLIDITDTVNKCLPKANLNTRFTPYCMLRIYADQIPNLPSKILYLDNDVVCLKDPHLFYDIDNSKYELVGALDYYGSHFLKKKIYRKDYLNSGVLLLNIDLIKKTKLFEKVRHRCQHVKMLMPDQTSLNLLSKKKLIVPNKFNDQKRITSETVFRHFSTTFRFWPKFHTQTIKPWHTEKLHSILNTHEFDDILDEYQIIIKKLKKGKK